MLSFEVASTELSYVSQLLIAKQLFLQPALKAIDTNAAQLLLTPDEVSLLFGNLDPLLKHANELCKQVPRSATHRALDRIVEWLRVAYHRRLVSIASSLHQEMDARELREPGLHQVLPTGSCARSISQSIPQ